MGPLVRPAQTPSSRQSGRWITGTPGQRRLWGGHREARGAIGRWARGRTPPGGGVLQAGAGSATPDPRPHLGAPLSPRGAPGCPGKGLSARGLCPGSPETRGARFRPSTRTHCGSSVPCKAGRSRRAAGGGARRSTAAEPPLASQSARPAVARPGLPGCGHARPGPGALLPGAPTGCSQCGPGLGAGPGRGGAGRRRVSGCSGNGDVPGVGGASTQVAYFRK